VYSPWDSSTFDIRLIVVKSHALKLLSNKIFTCTSSEHLTLSDNWYFFRIQTLYKWPENCRWCWTA